ncbi:GILT-like protein 3 [Leptopilina heterotoma]|uniref:GILT-like protein 3 n=1 Tax=Leptopilina heterotoma TaxID=63436 RepID=UPI001CA87761|nr:GILT-like protein 3 [Leptopilina heterotoma]
MGLGSFRYRILISVILIFLLYQSSKIWFPFTGSRKDSNQVNHGDAPADLNSNAPVVQTILVTVYYEALCPDSRSFFVKQLLPTFERISENIHLKPVPYGKAKTTKTDEGFSFECQHGPRECEANMIHACAIDVIKDQKQQLEYLTCMIKKNYEPQDIMKSCANNMGIKYQPIIDCYLSKGENLLAEYGEMTEANRKRISFIPAISLDEDFSNQPAILKNLLKQICLLLKKQPDGCF